MTLTSAWSTVPLPSVPITLVEHNGTLWVGGFQEMIAESRDGGAHWTVRNLKKKNGQLLTNFVFIGNHRIAVFGTAGVWYYSNDGGASWDRKEFHPNASFTKVEFPDELHGFAIGNNALATTADGGNHWNLFRGEKKNQWLKGRDHSQPVDLAAWDATHAVALVSHGDTEELWFTHDGGVQWRKFGLGTGVYWKSLRVHGDGFRMFGETDGSGKVLPAQVASEAPSQSTDKLTPIVVATPIAPLPAVYSPMTPLGSTCAAQHLTSGPFPAIHPIR